MIGRPDRTEAALYYFTYIDQAPGEDILTILETQWENFSPLYSSISEEKSLYRYAPDKWTIRQLLNHVTDTERVFQYRALWFARGFKTALPSFEQDVAAATAEADRIHWAAHLDEFHRVRLATVSFFRNLPPEAWIRSGIASEKRFTVRAIAFIIAGHFAHHTTMLRERYL